MRFNAGKRVFSVSAIISLLFIASAFADSSAIIAKANRLYRLGKYDEAIKFYNEAQIKNPDAPEIDYDIGAAEYKKGDYKAAVSSFERATVTKDKSLEAKANYNIADSKYRLGKLKQNTDLANTVQLFRESLDYYKRAIELKFRGESAKVNHELVERELKVLLDKLKKQQNKPGQQGGQKNEGQQQKQQPGQGQEQNQPKENNQPQQKQAEEKQAEEKKAEEKKVEAKQTEEKKSEEKQPGEKKEETSQEAAARKQKEEQEKAVQKDQAKEEPSSLEQAQEMSEEEAKMLLEGARQEEGALGKLDDTRKTSQADVQKDW